MGRYKARRIIIRKLPELTLVFSDKSSIYAYSSYGSVVFHKWYAPLGAYKKNWHPFKEALIHKKYLNWRLCFDLANRYGVQYIHTARELKFEGKPIDLRFENWSVKGVLDDVQKRAPRD